MIEAIAAIIFGAVGIVLVIIIGIRGHRENEELLQRIGVARQRRCDKIFASKVEGSRPRRCTRPH